MIQQVPAQPAWQGCLTARDPRAVTPPRWRHIKVYGTCHLEMQRRKPWTSPAQSPATLPKLRPSLP